MTSAKPVTALPAHELQQQLDSGLLTSRQLVEQCLAQIEKHNTNGLKLRAIISACPKDIVLAQADKLDEERKNGKDAIVTDPSLGMVTSAGAHAFANMKAKKNAALVDKLIHAGVIILGKGNLTELCGQKDKKTPIGWSAYGGQSISAYRREDLEEKDQPTPGGSSVGPALSIAAGFSPLGIGTETAGSNVFPASVNGLYGMTITLGSVASEGVQKLSNTYDRLGVMARSPASLAPLTQAILTDQAAQALPEGGFEDAMKKGWKGLSIGIVNIMWGIHEFWAEGKWDAPEITVKYSDAARKMEECGARVIYPLDVPTADMLKHGDVGLRAVTSYEFPGEIKKFISNFEPNAKITSLADIITWNEEHAAEAMPELHPGQSELIASRDDTLSQEAHDAAVVAIRKLAREDGVGRAMEEQKLDIVISASDATLVSWAAIAGWPIATVPVGRVPKNGQPWGLFAMARAGREDLLLKFMQAFSETFEAPDGPEGVFE